MRPLSKDDTDTTFEEGAAAKLWALETGNAAFIKEDFFCQMAQGLPLVMKFVELWPAGDALDDDADVDDDNYGSIPPSPPSDEPPPHPKGKGRRTVK